AERRPGDDVRAGVALPHRPPRGRRLLPHPRSGAEPAPGPDAAAPARRDAGVRTSPLMTTSVPALGEHHLPAIAELCRRGLADAPTEDELAGALCAPDQPAVIRGDPDVGIVATATWDNGGFIRLLVVDPDHRGKGHGKALLDAAEADLRDAGVSSV